MESALHAGGKIKIHKREREPREEIETLSGIKLSAAPAAVGVFFKIITFQTNFMRSPYPYFMA
jgi:hypothetical protein